VCRVWVAVWFAFDKHSLHCADAADPSANNSGEGSNGTASSRADEEQQLRIAEAVETVAEIELTAEQLKVRRAVGYTLMAFGICSGSQKLTYDSGSSRWRRLLQGTR